MSLISTVTNQENFSQEPLFSVNSPPTWLPSINSKPANKNPVQIKFAGGLDDKCVVSDDTDDYRSQLSASSNRDLNRKHFDPIRSITFPERVEIIEPDEVLGNDTSFDDDHRTIFFNLSKHSAWVSISVEMYSNWLRNSFLADQQSFSQSLKETVRQQNVIEYIAILTETLGKKGFSDQKTYEDSLGGQVIDFFRDEERLTYVISDTGIQVLAYLDGEFSTKMFDNAETSKISVSDYTENLFE